MLFIMYFNSVNKNNIYNISISIFADRQYHGCVTRNFYFHPVKYTDQTAWMICDRKDEVLPLYHDEKSLLLLL